MNKVEELDQKMITRMNFDIAISSERSKVMESLHAQCLFAIAGFFRFLTPTVPTFKAMLRKRRLRTVVLERIAHRRQKATYGAWVR